MSLKLAAVFLFLFGASDSFWALKASEVPKAPGSPANFYRIFRAHSGSSYEVVKGNSRRHYHLETLPTIKNSRFVGTPAGIFIFNDGGNFFKYFDPSSDASFEFKFDSQLSYLDRQKSFFHNDWLYLKDDEVSVIKLLRDNNFESAAGCLEGNAAYKHGQVAPEVKNKIRKECFNDDNVYCSFEHDKLVKKQKKVPEINSNEETIVHVEGHQGEDLFGEMIKRDKCKFEEPKPKKIRMKLMESEPLKRRLRSRSVTSEHNLPWLIATTSCSVMALSNLIILILICTKRICKPIQVKETIRQSADQNCA